jgi:dihydrolipoamide dehydrogenase
MYEDATKDFAHHGVIIEGKVSVDVKKMMDNKGKAVSGLTGGIEYLFKKYKVDYIKGFGKLTGPNSIDVALSAGGNQTVEVGCQMSSMSNTEPVCLGQEHLTCCWI